MALTTVDGGMLSATNAQYTMFKNKFINGAMQFWQRGTSFAAPANLSYTADRWFSIWGTANRTVSRQTGFSGSQYCMRVARNSGTTDNAYSGIVQIIETNNLYDLQGQNVTLSFSARRGANFSAASNALLVYLQYGTVADQGSSVYWSPGWTGSAYTIATTVTLSTTEQTFSLQGLIPSNALEVAVTFQYLSTGTAGANDYFEITNVQVEKGVTATSFDYRPYGTELALCQRYYWRKSGVAGTSVYEGIGSGSVYSTTSTVRVSIPYPVTMRATPTFSYGGTVYVATGGITTPSTITQYGGPNSGLIDLVITPASTIGQGAVYFVGNTINDYFQASAEL